MTIPFARIIPHFRHYFYAAGSTDQLSGELEDFMLLSQVYLRDLLKIDRTRFHANDVANFPTFSHNELPAILHWAGSFAERRRSERSSFSISRSHPCNPGAV